MIASLPWYDMIDGLGEHLPVTYSTVMPIFKQCTQKHQWHRQPYLQCQVPSVTPAVKTWIASATCISVLTFLSTSIFCLPISHWSFFFNRLFSTLQGSSSTFSRSSHLAGFPPTLSPRGSYPSWLHCTILATVAYLHALFPVGWWLVSSGTDWLPCISLRDFTNKEDVAWFSKESVESAVALAQHSEQLFKRLILNLNEDTYWMVRREPALDEIRNTFFLPTFGVQPLSPSIGTLASSACKTDLVGSAR